MIDDPELEGARFAVLSLLRRRGGKLYPSEIIAALTNAGYAEGLIRSANISIVARGEARITRPFELELVQEEGIHAAVRSM